MGRFRDNIKSFGFRRRRKKRNKRSKFFNQKILKENRIISRRNRQKISAKNFIPVKIIGKGAFGEVRLCKDYEGNYVAIKKLKIDDMISKNQIKHILAEREILLKAKNKWVVNLKACFKDTRYLYLGIFIYM